MKKILSSAILSACALAGMLVAAPARAWQFEYGAGGALYDTEDGRWNQQGAPNDTLRRLTKAWSLGLTGDLYTGAPGGLAWHLDYVNLGHASASCDCTLSDADYDRHASRVTRPDAPLAHYSGTGYASGITLTAEPYRIINGWRIAGEAGVFMYRPKWNETVTGGINTGDAPPLNVAVSTPRVWRPVPMIGLSIGQGNWALRYRHYFMRKANDHTVPPLWNDAEVLEYVLKF